ncbi:hypothetical protein F4861DRAFT_506378 [Xylaria intraflava]|nr:hypothetical protein F4861DRAFT_506378 [Xylaria intraflava]
MDGVQMAGSLVPSPAKGKGNKPKKTTGRGVSKRKGKRGGNGKGRGKSKVYEDPRLQAAYDRQKILRNLFSEVASVMKPVLDHLAAESIKTLIENPTSYKDVPEYDVVKRQLDEHLQEATSAANREFTVGAAIATREYQLHTAVTEKKFQDGLDLASEDFYDASLNRAIILAQQQRDGTDADVPDATYTYVEKPNDVVDEQGVWVLIRDGVEVPYPSLLEENKKSATAKAQANKGRSAAKRKAEDQPDSQPNAKKSADLSGSAKPDNGDESATPQPRHIKGLLSAEAEPEGELESNAASPSPDSGPKTGPSRGKKAVPAIPDGASEPDKWGVRVVTRKGQKANNRIMVPRSFTSNDSQIGIRSSANKKAMSGARGKSNNSNAANFHVDRTIANYDCLTYEDGALDPELIEKHGMHPKYGLFLPGSCNELEPPKPYVSGSNSIVVTTPNGATLHASRSVKKRKMDDILHRDAKRIKLAALLKQYCEETGITSEEITTEELRERDRQRQVAEESPARREDEERPVKEERDSRETRTKENISQILNAAWRLNVPQPSYPVSNQRQSRPYDAVRDVFTTTSAATAEPVSQPSLPAEVDTSRLSFLADVCGQVSLQREAPSEPSLDHRLQSEYRPESQLGHHANNQFGYGPEYVPDHHRPVHHLEHRLEQADLPSLGDSMIDPRLRGPANPIPPPPPNSFLQTALNPTPAFAHIAPAPAQGVEPSTQASIGRNPFTTQGNGKGDHILPPLRPSREQAMDPTNPQLPLVQQAPEFGPLGMTQSNSGIFFPPPPARPYHQPYTLPEQAPMMATPFTAPGANMTSPQPSIPQVSLHRPSFHPVSPPMPAHAHAHVGVMPMNMQHGPPVSPPGLTVGPRSPTAPPGGRHRPSISSGSNGAGNGKYRRIAAAPIPHNRPWPGNGGAELRLAHYDHKESIKDYSAIEPPPRTGPTTIRGWSVNNVSKGRKSLKKEDSDEKDSPSITTFIGKWDPSERPPMA